MAIETNSTDRSIPANEKQRGGASKPKRARRKRPGGRPAETRGAGGPANSTAAGQDRAVQVDVAQVAAEKTSGDTGPAPASSPRRVRVRKTDTTAAATRAATGSEARPPSPPALQRSGPAGANAGGSASQGLPTEQGGQRPRRGRRPPRTRHRQVPPAELPTSPAQALQTVPPPDRQDLGAEREEAPEASWLTDTFDSAPMHSVEVGPASDEQIVIDAPPPDVSMEARPRGERVTTIEPPEPSDGSRRRRRGRRGRRGGKRAGPPPDATVPTEAPASRRDEPISPPVETVPSDDEEPPVDMEEPEHELLESELEITPFAERGGKSKSPPGRELIINISTGFECRVAILHEGRLEELFIERESTQSHVGNIYKGRVTNVEPSIQAAFVDFGLEKNGFLHISDVQPQYFPNHSGAAEDVGRKIPRHQRPPIQKCFRRGQEVIVQITKEGVGTKGPTLTSYLSIPGRYLVMMPGMSHTGVSRKIEDETARRRMREVLDQLTLPKGIGFILRTAGLDRPKRELQRDLNYLLRLWKTVVDRIKRQRAPAELYRESDLVIRTLRDVYTSDFSRIVVDDAVTARKVREFLRIAMPRTKVPIELYSDREPLFHRLGVETEIERINMRHVPLASGGSLVIDSTEAMVAIDVNSGRFRTLDDAEETALRINVEAAEEIGRQLRLRDLGGLIVCDFIDMRHERNKRKVEQTLREALKKHKERARILRMSQFGLIEMTRQRQGPSIRRNLYHDCPHCRGAGQVKLPETVMLDAMRMIQLAAHQEHVSKIVVSLAPDVAYAVLNRKRTTLNQIESETGKRVVIVGKPDFTSDQMELLCEDNRGRELTLSGAPAAS